MQVMGYILIGVLGFLFVAALTAVLVLYLYGMLSLAADLKKQDIERN